MMGLNITVNGGSELVKTFSRAKNFVDENFTDALDKVLLSITGDAKTYSPVKTGHLRRSIHQEGPSTSGGVIRGVVGTDVFYAPYQEFGTSRGVPAKLYMTQALQRAKTTAPGFLREALEKTVVNLAN